MVWRPQFTLPEVSSLPGELSETVYTVDYQGVRIIVLNCRSDPEAQVDYLREQLQRPGADWTLVSRGMIISMQGGINRFGKRMATLATPSRQCLSPRSADPSSTRLIPKQSTPMPVEGTG